MGRSETCSWGEHRRQRTCAKAKTILSPSLGLGIDSSTVESTTPSTIRASLEVDTGKDCAGSPSDSVAIMGKYIITGSDVGEAPSKGVRKRGNKWVAEIRNRQLRGGRHPGRKWLGTFSTAAEAREAYAKAIKKIRPPSQRAPAGPGNGSSKVLILETSNTSLSLSSSLCSISAGTGAKRGPESSPDGHKRSKKARTSVSLGNDPGSGSVGNQQVLSSDLDSTHHEDGDQEGINGSASFEQGGGKGAMAMPSSTVSSSCDSPRGTLPISQLATESRTLSPKDCTTSKELPLASCFTSVAISHHSSCNDQTSAAVSPSSSSATSRWIDEFEGVKNQSLDDSSREVLSRGREKGVINASDEDGALNSTSAPCDVSNDASGVSTIFSYSNPTVDDIIIWFSVPAKIHYNWPWSSSEQANSFSWPLCTSVLIFTDKHRCSPAGPCFCNCGCQLFDKGKVELSDISVQYRPVNQEENFPQEREELLHFVGMKVNCKIEDLAAFKTSHLLSELSRPESDPEWRCTGIAQAAEDFPFPQPIRKSTDGENYGKTRSSPGPVFEFSLHAASFPFCSRYDTLEHQVYVIEELSDTEFGHLLEPKLMETDFLTLDTGLDLSPVDDFLGYF